MESASKGISDICSKYPSLIAIDEITIKGILPINEIIKDEHIIDSFEVLIDFSSVIPKVIDVENRTKEYHHKYKEGNLCLETDLIQLMYLKEHTYLEWLDYFVVYYFCSFLYYKKYKNFPFGERQHFIGDFEAYADFIQMDLLSAWNTLEYIIRKKYRGHNLCPCGSNKKLRGCHKNMIINFQQDEIVFDALNRLYKKTKGELQKYGNKKKK